MPMLALPPLILVALFGLPLAEDSDFSTMKLYVLKAPWLGVLDKDGSVSNDIS